MAPGMKTTTKMKHSDEHEGASHGYEEGKGPHGPVLIEKPGAAQSNKLDGSGLRITIIASCWYEKVVHSLVDDCSKELLAKGVADEDLHLMKVSGAFEIPFAAARLVHCKDTSYRPDAVICIGCIVNGPTHMCEVMSQSVANGIMKLNVTSDTPVIFGVLCCNSETQAHACAEKQSCNSGGESHKCNHGVSWAQSALEMAHLKRFSSSKKVDKCHCLRCESRRGGESSKGQQHESDKYDSSKLKSHGTCTTCGSSAEKCLCKQCKCKVCCDNRGDCTSCKSSGGNCSCEDCKCRSCCTKREACRGCGCPPDKCSCQGCNCAACIKKNETIGMKMPMPSSELARCGLKHVQSTECPRCGTPVPSGEVSAGKHESSLSSSGEKHKPESSSSTSSALKDEPTSKLGSSTSSSSVKYGKTTESCARCGSPGGECKCGLLH